MYKKETQRLGKLIDIQTSVLKNIIDCEDESYRFRDIKLNNEDKFIHVSSVPVNIEGNHYKSYEAFTKDPNGKQWVSNSVNYYEAWSFLMEAHFRYERIAHTTHRYEAFLMPLQNAPMSYIQSSNEPKGRLYAPLYEDGSLINRSLLDELTAIHTGNKPCDVLQIAQNLGYDTPYIN